MSSVPMEHPSVELSVDHVLVPASIATLTARNATAAPPQAIKAAIEEYRQFAIKNLREGLIVGGAAISDEAIRVVLGSAWHLFSPIFKRSLGPMIAEAYIRAFRDAHEGTVPISLIYQLADEHAERIGKYYNDTSADALVQGFNTYVNRKLPQKAAMERVIDAYGMTPRQMSGFTSATALQPQEIKSGVAQNLKRKVKAYIGASISQRLKIFAGQEEHNIEEQAKQMAWMWLMKEGRIAENAEKMWLTQKDERVCPTCGPLHGRRIPLKETFALQSGLTIYTPGAHVNCRCELRLMVPPKLEAVKKADFDERKHRRARDGRFTFKPVTQQESATAPRVKEQEAVDPRLVQLAAEARTMKSEQRKARIKRAEEELRQQTADLLGSSQAEPETNLLGTTTSRSLLGETSSNLLPKRIEIEEKKDLLGAPKQDLLSGQRADLLGRQELSLEPRRITLSEEKINELALQLDQLMQSAEQPLKARKRKTREEFRPTVKFDKTVFGFISTYDVDDYGDDSAPEGRVRIPERTRLTAFSDPMEAREQLLDQAINVYTQQMYRLSDSIIEDHTEIQTGNIVIPRDHPEHGTLYASITEEDVLNAVDAAVNRKSDWARARRMSLPWANKDGEVIFEEDHLEAQISPVELADLLGVNTEELGVAIVALNEGQEDSYLDTAATRKGEEVWYAPGVYRIAKKSSHIMADAPSGYSTRNEAAVPLTFYTLEPDVPSDFWAERTMTDEEVDRELGFE